MSNSRTKIDQTRPTSKSIIVQLNIVHAILIIEKVQEENTPIFGGKCYMLVRHIQSSRTHCVVNSDDSWPTLESWLTLQFWLRTSKSYYLTRLAKKPLDLVTGSRRRSQVKVNKFFWGELLNKTVFHKKHNVRKMQQALNKQRAWGYEQRSLFGVHVKILIYNPVN